jgi:hypothetical protein
MPLALDFDDDGALHALVLSSNLSNGGQDVPRAAEIITIDPAAYDDAVWENSTEFDLEGRFNGLAVTAEGNYVLIEETSDGPEDDAATTVYLVTPEGDEIDSWEVAGHAAAVNRTSAGVGLQSSSAGELIVLADPIGQRVLFLQPDGALAEAWQAAPADLAVPSSIDLNDAGELAVLDVPAGSISIFGPDGAGAVRHEIDVLRPHPTFGVTGRTFYGHDNEIWYIDYNAASPFSLYRLDLATGDIEQFATNTILDDDPIPVIFDPISGAVGDDGRLYLAIGGGETGGLWSFDLEGAAFEAPLSAHDDYFVSAVFDVTTGPDGIYTLWNGRIDDQWGTFVSLVAGGARETAEVSVANTYGPLPPGPRAIAVGEDRLMYLLDPWASEIDILRPDRTYHAIWSARLYAERQITDIAVDQSGQVYLSDVLQHEVLIYAPVAG